MSGIADPLAGGHGGQAADSPRGNFFESALAQAQQPEAGTPAAAGPLGEAAPPLILPVAGAPAAGTGIPGLVMSLAESLGSLPAQLTRALAASGYAGMQPATAPPPTAGDASATGDGSAGVSWNGAGDPSSLTAPFTAGSTAGPGPAGASPPAPGEAGAGVTPNPAGGVTASNPPSGFTGGTPTAALPAAGGGMTAPQPGMGGAGAGTAPTSSEGAPATGPPGGATGSSAATVQPPAAAGGTAAPQPGTGGPGAESGPNPSGGVAATGWSGGIAGSAAATVPPAAGVGSATAPQPGLGGAGMPPTPSGSAPTTGPFAGMTGTASVSSPAAAPTTGLAVSAGTGGPGADPQMLSAATPPTAAGSERMAIPPPTIVGGAAASLGGPGGAGPAEAPAGDEPAAAAPRAGADPAGEREARLGMVPGLRAGTGGAGAAGNPPTPGPAVPPASAAWADLAEMAATFRPLGGSGPGAGGGPGVGSDPLAALLSIAAVGAGSRSAGLGARSEAPPMDGSGAAALRPAGGPANAAAPAVPQVTARDLVGQPSPIPARVAGEAPVASPGWFVGAPPPQGLARSARPIAGEALFELGERPPGMATYGERLLLPLDLTPARPRRPIWRVDDTLVLVRHGAGEAGAAAGRAAELWRGLRHGGWPLLALQPGEGLEGSAGTPLWLRLAGVDKPEELGVALHEAAPARFALWRERWGWRIAHSGGALPRSLRGEHGDAAEEAELRRDLAFAWPPDLPEPPAATALLRALAMAEDPSGRRQEALAMLVRDAILAARGVPNAVTQTTPAEVLARVTGGELSGLNRAEGRLLASALGRLPPCLPS